MLIDWYTVAAQGLNFLILVVLLKVFLFDRVIGVMDKRQRDIDQRLREAKQSREQAEELKRTLEREQRILDQGREQALREAARNADTRRRELLQEARQEIDRQRAAWLESLHRDRQDLDRRLTSALANGVLDVCARALGDLADENLISRMCSRFLRELENLPSPERDKLFLAMEHNRRLEITTSFALPAKEKERIGTALRSLFDTQADIAFSETLQTPGITLNADGHRFGWNVGRYFEHLSRSVEELLTDHESNEPTGNGDNE